MIPGESVAFGIGVELGVLCVELRWKYDQTKGQHIGLVMMMMMTKLIASGDGDVFEMVVVASTTPLPWLHREAHYEPTREHHGSTVAT